MGKRRGADRTPRPQDVRELVSLGQDELHARKRVAAKKMQIATEALNATIREHSAICAALKALRENDPNMFGVSDHAVLRYLQRVKGLDVRMVRDEIRAMAESKLDPAQPEDQIINGAGDLRIAVSQGVSITTVWTEPPNPRSAPPPPRATMNEADE